MTAIGEQLKKAREQKNLSLDQVADDTNIAKRYLVALEEENFAAFPAEPYTIGFIRNYADYLGLRSEELVASYKGMRIQEAPVPIDQLIPQRERRLPIPLIIGLSALAAIAIGAVAFIAIGGSSADDEEAQKRQPMDYPFQGVSFERRLYPGDGITVEFEGQTYRIGMEAITDYVSLETPVGSIQYRMAEEGTIDLDKNNRAEFRVYVSDFQKNDPDKGALVRFDLIGQGVIAAVGAGSAEGASEEAIPTKGLSKVIFSNVVSPHPFGLQIVFRGPVLLRYEIDRKDRRERYYTKNDAMLYVEARDDMKLWVSNAANVELAVRAGGKTVEFSVGALGEVAVKAIKWVRNEAGTWQLALFDVD
jgi:cytoskeletal protein RodZ